MTRVRHLPPIFVASRRQQEEEEESGGFSTWKRLMRKILFELKEELGVALFGTVAAIVRAMGAQVNSGESGVLFSFGRASKVLPPGFRPLIPFLQRVRKIPTRSRTMDLPAQRVETRSGHVYHADANLVYRITDAMKALVQIDDLQHGMRTKLMLGTQEVLREQDRTSIQNTALLSAKLGAALADQLEPWGVTVERAAFTSITPSPRTLRITQLSHRTQERNALLGALEKAGMQRETGICLMGTRVTAISRTKYLRNNMLHKRRWRRLRKALMRRGWLTVQIVDAGRTLAGKVGADGKLRVEARSVGKD